jgi:hypothetical protein
METPLKSLELEPFTPEELAQVNRIRQAKGVAPLTSVTPWKDNPKPRESVRPSIRTLSSAEPR